ncbi:hypothetical protein GCM10025331_68120 [Actinoplanes utahensis]|nr:hypothetical protein Aut01nite_01000 [Actinoplanes utahensis]
MARPARAGLLPPVGPCESLAAADRLRPTGPCESLAAADRLRSTGTVAGRQASRMRTGAAVYRFGRRRPDAFPRPAHRRVPAILQNVSDPAIGSCTRRVRVLIRR